VALTKALGGSGGGGGGLSDGDYGDIVVSGSGTVLSIDDDVALGGSPTTTTQAAGDNSTKLATTAYADAAAAAVTGSRVLLATQTLAVATATVTFSSIVGTYSDLLVQVIGRGTAATASVQVHLRFNGISTATYDWSRENRFGSAQGAASTFIELASVAAGSAPATTATFLDISIPRYAATTWHKTAQAIAFVKEGTAVGNMRMEFSGGLARATTAISQIDLFLSSGNWDAGSTFRLIGIV
jgi:hypothetical protein